MDVALQHLFLWFQQKNSEQVGDLIKLVRGMRIELTRASHTPLKRTRLPVPPPAHYQVA